VVTVALARSEDAVAVTVRDDGPGLSDADKRDATQRFWRGSTATPGTGLGLAIVDALAAASGATLELGDAPDGGLAVTVTFRAAAPGAGPPPPAP